jgi:hypothetical protein
MGLFDDVRAEGLECGSCGEPLPAESFQSKDGPCELAMLDWREVRQFYTSCPKCREWNSFRSVPPEGEWRIERVL